MTEVRLIDANALKEEFLKYKPYAVDFLSLIDNAPTVEYPFYAEAYQTGYEEGKNERPKSNSAKQKIY